jgi:WD40 repeat protein
MARRHLRFLFSFALCAAVGCHSDLGLKGELSRLSSQQGVALIRIQGGPVEVLTFDSTSKLGKIKPHDGPAFLSANGEWVAWTRLGAPPCPIRVESRTGSWLGTVPGTIANVLVVGVSPDGKKVAFNALYDPPDGGSRTEGLQYADVAGGKVTFVEPEWVGDSSSMIRSISWSPDSRAFAYDREEELYVYDTRTGASRWLAAGSYPVWSPDGKWIAFRSSAGELNLLDPASLQYRVLIPSRKILGVLTWSPDSKYLIFAETDSLGFLLGSKQLVVYRVRDSATTPVFWIGTAKWQFFWINDYRAFVAHLQ